MIITFSKVRIEETYLNITKAIQLKSTASIILNSEKLKAFSLRTEIKQGCPFSPPLFKIVLEVQPQQSDKKNEIKGIKSEKINKTVIICRCHDYICVCIYVLFHVCGTPKSPTENYEN